MTRFQSDENAEYLVGISKTFLEEKHNIQIKKEALQQVIRQAVSYIIEDPNHASKTIEELNKRTLVFVRNYVLKLQQFQANQANQANQPFPSNNQPSIPENEQPPSVNESEKPEEVTFFQKLEKLELQRKLPMPQDSITQPVQTIQPVQSSQPVQPVQPIQTTIIMENKMLKKRCVSITVDSSTRMWMYQPKRSNFVWSGTIPSTIDLSSTRILTVILPSIHSPKIRVIIEGVQGSEATILMYPDKQYKSWTYYKPFDESLAYIRALSTPWTVTIYDDYEQEASIGCDSWKVRDIKVKPELWRSTNIIFVEPFGHTGDIYESFGIDDILCVQSPDGKQQTCKVIAVHHDAIEVDKCTSEVDSLIMNMSKQVSIVIGCELSEQDVASKN